MKKADLIAKLEVVKDHSPVVSIEKVIELIQSLEPEVRVEKVLGMSQELAEQIADKIERCLDYNSGSLIDTSSAEFELTYSNEIVLISADVDVREIIEHVTASLEEFIIEEEEDVPAETDGFIEAQIEAEDSDAAYEATLK